MGKQPIRRKGVSYAKWGYIFIAPFFIAYAIFHLAPQVLTVYNSFFENYREGLTQVGPNFVGLKNYVTLFTPAYFKMSTLPLESGVNRVT